MKIFFEEAKNFCAYKMATEINPCSNCLLAKFCFCTSDQNYYMPSMAYYDYRQMGVTVDQFVPELLFLKGSCCKNYMTCEHCPLLHLRGVIANLSLDSFIALFKARYKLKTYYLE